MSNYRNHYEVKVEHGNPAKLYQFRIWTEEALGGEWGLEMDVPVAGRVEIIYEPIGASWPNGDARYFADAPAAFAHIERMIPEEGESSGK